MTSEPDSTSPDTKSDPALDDGESADWSAEGGATEQGPATDDDNNNDDASGDGA